MAKARILLVDDDPRLRSILLRYLEMQDFSVCGVASTALMDRMLEREFFDLLLLDVMMPGEDGFEACARLRRQEPQLPIIMLTARGDLDDRVQGLSLGADDYLAKPFEPEELVARIRAVLRRSGELGCPRSKLGLFGIVCSPAFANASASPCSKFVF
jgi:two-component system phosphate regulon response regulator OmpR